MTGTMSVGHGGHLHTTTHPQNVVKEPETIRKFTHQFGVQMGAHLGFKLVSKLLMLF